MKIIKENEAYVQKKDLIFMQYSLNNLPESIVNRYFSEGREIDIDVFGDYDFIKFEEESEINFIKEQEFILNMTVVEGLTIEQVIEIGRTLAKEGDTLTEEMYNSTVKDEEVFFIKYKEINYKLDILMDVLAYKQGLLQLFVPEINKLETVEEQVVCIAADQTQQRTHNFGEWEQLPNGDEQRICQTCGYKMVKSHNHMYPSSPVEEEYVVQISEQENTDARNHLYGSDTPSTGTGKSL